MASPFIPANERRILIVDDDPQVIEIVLLSLESEGYPVKTASNGHDAVKVVEEWRPHLVILDVNMPKKGGIETLQEIRALPSENYISVLMLSGNSATDEVVVGLDAGADDYIAKPFAPEELLARVRTQLRIKDLNDQLLEANAKLKELIDIDDLTGLLNMRSMYQRLDYEMKRGKRFNRTVCVVMLDMDYFKTVNDGHDHLFGSFVLSEVGKIIKSTIRNVDIAARYGGDEFMIILTEVDRMGARQFCERLRAKIETYQFENGPDQIKLTASLGFSLTDPLHPDIDPRDLVRIADRALYDAKHAGRNQVCHYDLSESPDLQMRPRDAKKKAL